MWRGREVESGEGGVGEKEFQVRHQEELLRYRSYKERGFHAGDTLNVEHFRDNVFHV